MCVCLCVCVSHPIYNNNDRIYNTDVNKYHRRKKTHN